MEKRKDKSMILQEIFFFLVTFITRRLFMGVQGALLVFFSLSFSSTPPPLDQLLQLLNTLIKKLSSLLNMIIEFFAMIEAYTACSHGPD